MVLTYQHLESLTDERGLFEHAEYDQPRIEHGYCVDDVARALTLLMRDKDTVNLNSRGGQSVGTRGGQSVGTRGGQNVARCCFDRCVSNSLINKLREFKPHLQCQQSNTTEKVTNPITNERVVMA